MRGRWQAITAIVGLAFLSLFMPPISIVSSAAVALVTLRRGAYEGLTVFGVSLAILGTLGALVGNIEFALLYGVVLWLPIWIIAILLRAGRQLALAIESAVLLGGVGIIGFYLYKPDAVEMWKHLLMQMSPPNAALDMQPQLESISHYMTGIIAAGTIFGWVFALFMARWWQAQLYNPDGFRTEYLGLSTSPRLALGSIGLVGIAMLSSGGIAELAWNLSILVFVLYTFVGTAVLHSLLAPLKQGRYFVIGLYMTVFLIPHLLIPVATIGVADAWLNLRQKLKTK
ncbi:MAG: hypothetical protein PHN45_05675 [Methylococcales bacterium]|nr:hypothetical protein [Methylococcales bacterium]MDD5754224.1 hypothetical protein [Methylococcales bacterium]